MRLTIHKYCLQRRSHQFTGLINAIIKVLCNVQQTVGYCEKGYIQYCIYVIYIFIQILCNIFLFFYFLF